MWPRMPDGADAYPAYEPGAVLLKRRRPDKAQPPSGGVLHVARMPDGADAYPAYEPGAVLLKRRRPDKAQPPSGGVLHVAPHAGWR